MASMAGAAVRSSLICSELSITGGTIMDLRIRLLAGIAALGLAFCGTPQKSCAVDFSPPTTYPVGTFGYYPPTVAVGDFDGNGKPDIAVANSGSGNVSILLGMATGLFKRR